METFLIIYVWAASAILSGWLAGQKKRSVIAWVFLGIAFGPLALLAMIATPEGK